MSAPDPDTHTKAGSITTSWFRDVYPAVNPKNDSVSQAGKVTIITGAGRGIGASIAVTHARAGAKGLVLVARSIAGLEKTKETVLMENPSLNVLCIAADISDETSVAELYSQIKFKFGIADTLINNAGVFSEPFDVIDKASPVSWWKDFEINVKGTFLMTAGFLRLAKESHLALPTIVNLTTNVSLTPPSLSSYFTSKIAVVKFTEFIAVENPEVVAYSLSPGIVNTDMTLDSFKPFAKDSQLTGAVTVYLAGKRPDYLNGRHLVVNWDVDELESRKLEIRNSDMLKLGLSL